MSFFKKVFGGGDPGSSSEAAGASTSAPHAASGGIQFGRYTDCNKTKQQVEYWNQSVEKFKNKQYVDSFESFMKYLRDETVDNVKVNRNGDEVSFELLQGSKIIKGKANKEKFEAEANLALMDAKNIPVMRKLMSINYSLLYSKFALTDNTLCMKFGSHAIDASPNKLYAALKELAKKADQQDDLLVSEFSSLKAVDTDNIIELSPEMREIRYNYLIKLINDTKAEIAKHDPEHMGGGIAFLLLNLTYKIDYLIMPQGNLTDALERIQRIFFDNKSQATTRERNDQIIAEYDKIVNSPKEDIYEGLYDVKCTFAIANAATHKTAMDMMFKEREKVAWYRDNNYPQMVEAIYGYMISYAFFNYGMVYPMTDLLDMAMNVMNPDYYQQCGKPSYISNGVLNSSAIVKDINGAMDRAKTDYPYVTFNTSMLNFTNVTNFVDSLIVEMDKMDLRK